MQTTSPISWKRPLWVVLVIALAAGLAASLVVPGAPALSQDTNLITNGSFEEGFTGEAGVIEGLADGWGRFDNGSAFVGWYDDTWPLVVADGEHAQLIEVKNSTDQSRFAGIFQTVSVSPGKAYQLSLKGLVRSDEGNSEDSSFGYIMELGLDHSGGTDWQAVETWIELPFEEQPRLGPANGVAFELGSFETTITPSGDKLTLFIRGVKKWPGEREGNFDVDAVSLVAVDGTPPPTTAPDAPLPETGNTGNLTDNLIRLVASGILVLVLAGGAILSLNRRRA